MQTASKYSYTLVCHKKPQIKTHCLYVSFVGHEHVGLFRLYGKISAVPRSVSSTGLSFFSHRKIETENKILAYMLSLVSFVFKIPVFFLRDLFAIGK